MLIARFAPWLGLPYSTGESNAPFPEGLLITQHSHNLIREEQVSGLSLNETNLFIDPLDPLHRAKSLNQAEFISRTGLTYEAIVKSEGAKRAVFVDKYPNKHDAGYRRDSSIVPGIAVAISTGLLVATMVQPPPSATLTITVVATSFPNVGLVPPKPDPVSLS